MAALFVLRQAAQREGGRLTNRFRDDKRERPRQAGGKSGDSDRRAAVWRHADQYPDAQGGGS